jgi:energy-coupling factor transporter ATP-binding protein EcfA2
MLGDAMIATELHIENFRGIREGKLTDLADVNVLIGRNGSGKSTVAEAVLRVAMGQSNPFDVVRRDVDALLRAQRQESEKDPQSQWFRSLLRSAIRFELTLSDGRKQRVERVAPHVAFRVDGEELDAVATMQVGLFRAVEGADSAIEKRLWRQTLLSRGDKALIKVLNSLFDMKCEQMHEAGDKFLLLFDSYGVPLDGQGDGVRTALRALLYVASMAPGILVLEEPECHQHPASLKKYAQAVVSLAKERGVQLFVTTQSKTALMAFVDGAESAKASAMVHHLALHDGALDVRKITPDTLRIAEGSGTDVMLLDQYA